MFKFLIRKNRILNTSVAKAAFPAANEIIPVESSKQKMIDSFVKKISFHGKSLKQYSIKCLSQLAKEKEISQGAFFITDMKDGKPVLRFLSAFASSDPEKMDDTIEFGEGFPGQVAKDGKMINISDIPEGYLTIESGLGKAAPTSLILFPVKHGDNVLAVIELASFQRFTEEDELFFGEISPYIAEQILKCTTKP